MNEIRRFNLSDLIIYILKQWKKILLFALIFSLAIGILIFLKNSNIRRGKEQLEEPTVISVESYSLEDQDIYYRQEDVMITSDKLFFLYDDYLKNSIKMQLNPGDFFEGEMKCIISGDTSRDVLRLRCLFEQSINKEEFFNGVRQKLGVEIKDSYIREILSVSFDIYEEDLTGIMTFKVKHFDEESCYNILEIIKKQVSDVEQKNCQVEILDLSIAKTSDMELVSEQNEIYEWKWVYYDRFGEAKAERTKLEEKYSSVSNQELYSLEKFSIFKCVIIFLIGMILSIGCFIIKYLFSDLIHTRDDINGLDKIPIVTVAENNVTNMNFIERCIWKLEKRMGNISSNSLEMDMMSIVISLKQKNVEEICLTSTLFDKDYELDFYNRIKEIFSKYNINLILIKNILSNMDSLQEIVKTENVVLYEVCEKSSYNDLSSEVLKLQQCGIGIQGIILEK